MTEKKITFEEAYKKLDEAAKNIMSDGVQLEDALESYKEGRKYYGICQKILQDAEQMIQIYDKEADSLKEMPENE
jgi:exodeoxyribonuclease VII small subunit